MAARGWQVHAGVRKAADGESLVDADARIRPLSLEITDADSIAAAVGQLEQLDAVVNNAGIVVTGPIEAVSLDDLRHQLEVNVTGQVAVTQAVLPLLRASKGRIVMMSSVSGRVPFPLMGAYSASKFALEAIADSLRMELRPWGIKVAVVEPGSIDTDLWRQAPDTAAATEAGLAPGQRELYGTQLAGMAKLIPEIQKRTAPVAKVGEAVEHALTATRPRARYPLGVDARAQMALRAFLPAPLVDAAFARVVGGR